MMTGFHPLVSRWFFDALGEPTSAQRRGWTAIRAGQHTLIAAPTGSGKTLAAFLTSIDDLVREGLESPLPDAVRVVYVSPLKALSADIHKNLAEPRRALRKLAEETGLEIPRITAAVRALGGANRELERADRVGERSLRDDGYNALRTRTRHPRAFIATRGAQVALLHRWLRQDTR